MAKMIKILLILGVVMFGFLSQSQAQPYYRYHHFYRNYYPYYHVNYVPRYYYRPRY